MNTNQRKPMSLRAIITELLACYGQVSKKSSKVINAVPAEILVSRGENWLAPLMGDLYSILSSAKEQETIYISAKSIMGEITLFIAEKKNIAPVVARKTQQQALPAMNVLPAKFHFGFRA